MPAPAFRRPKRVTYLLDDKVKAHLRGEGGGDHRPPPAGYPSSSGSEHEACDLSVFVRGFFFSDDEGLDLGPGAATEYDDDERGKGEVGPAGICGAVPAAAMIRDMVATRAAASTAEDRFRRDLAAGASGAVEAFPGLRANRSAFLRAVMGSLTEIGYNAGICKSRWESSGGGLTAGSYEYIDVVTPPARPAAATASLQLQRYIVDVDFAAEFEIARPTAEYERVVAELPRVFVGRPEELRRLLRVVADAVRRSLRAREMHVPPWRKARYMQAKWLGPYRRTLNPVPSGSSAAATAASPPTPSFGPERGGVKCWFVGFDTAAPVVISPAARTR